VVYAGGLDISLGVKTDKPLDFIGYKSPLSRNNLKAGVLYYMATGPIKVTVKNEGGLDFFQVADREFMFCVVKTGWRNCDISKFNLEIKPKHDPTFTIEL